MSITRFVATSLSTSRVPNLLLLDRKRGERDRAMCVYVVTNRHHHTTKRITHIRIIFPLPRYQGIDILGSISTMFIVYIHANLAGMPLCGVYTRWRAFRR